MKPLVYLSGPITGCTYEECGMWRKVAAESLAPEIGVMDPIREFSVSWDLRPSSYVARDFFDIRRSDLVLANVVGARTVSLGTVSEIGYAYALNKPVILVRSSDDLVHRSPFVTELASFWAENLHEGIALARTILFRN